MRSLQILLLIATLSFAQDTTSPNTTPEPGARLQELQKRLNLTEDQENKIRPILLDEATKLRAIRDKHQNDTSRRGKLQAARELKSVQSDIDKRVNPILTKQQRDEWKKIREERRDQIRAQKGK